MVLSDWVRWFRFDKINHRLRLIVPLADQIVSKLYSISFFKSEIFLQQSIAPLEGISAHFSNVYCTILKEMRKLERADLLG